jgi:1,4-alpha-glucan branching enzyme
MQPSMALDAGAHSALAQGNHPDPFSVLGLHQLNGRFVLRAWIPGAEQITAIDLTGKTLAVLKACGDGLFEAPLAIKARMPYRLRVRMPGQPQFELADAYAFGAQLSDADLQALQAGQHARPFEVLGAHVMQLNEGGGHLVDGTRFAVWAPNASRVSVVGNFNGWDGRRHPMRLRHDAGIWEIFIPHVALDDLYKFELLDASGVLLPLKADPYARAAELRPGTASKVASLPAKRPLPDGRAQANARRAPMAIYEVHVGSWRRDSQGGFASWDELAQLLPAYADELGFTHIELMPISEFPFDGSWGYQTLGLFAPSARFGTMAGFQRFVDACHARGLGLLLDWVPAHFPEDAHGFARFDGTALYEYADPREGFHRDWNTLIYNFGRIEVSSFLRASALYWLERFGVDGLRVDAVASMLYRDYSRNAGEWVANHLGGRENLEAIGLFRTINEQLGAAVPGAITIAEESTAFPQVSAPTFAGGLGFHYKWNMGWMNDSLRYMAQDPVHRRWHHHLMSFGLVYAFSENYILPISHDEVVHGKGSMLQKMPGDSWQKFANLRAYYGFMWGHPGKKLLFMGQEFAQDHEWSHERELPWYLLDQPRHEGVRRLIKDLNALYRSQLALHQLDCDAAGFEWLNLDDAEHSVYAFARFDDAGNAVIVACNFTPVVRADYVIGISPRIQAHHWREALNTDSQYYGGANNGNGARQLTVNPIRVGTHERSMTLTLPPLGTVFLVAQ